MSRLFSAQATPTVPSVLDPTAKKRHGIKSKEEVQELTEEEVKALRNTLDIVIFRFYSRHPFYALLLERCKILLTRQVPTAAISNNARLYINPEFFDGLTLKQKLFLLAHEVMHAAFQHHSRLMSRQHRLWNMATDYVINDMLIQDLGEDAFIPNGLRARNLNQDLTSEDVYEMLKNIQDDSSGPGGANPGGGTSGRGTKLAEDNPQLDRELRDQWNNGSPYYEDMIDDVSDELDDGAKVGRENMDKTPETREEWEGAVAQAATRSKIAGNLPAHMDMAIKDFLEPKVDWAKRLASRISQVVCKENRSDYDWMSPSRRWLGQDIILPSMVGYRKSVAIWVDTSGSMYDNWLQACSDIEKIRKQYNIEVYLMWQDYDLYVEGWLSPNQPFPKMAQGGGGTSFVPAYNHLIEEKIYNRIDACIGFTDCWGQWPEEPPFHNITVTFSNDSCPWGETIHVKQQDLGR